MSKGIDFELALRYVIWHYDPSNPQAQKPGGFYQMLLSAMMLADADNLEGFSETRFRHLAHVMFLMRHGASIKELVAMLESGHFVEIDNVPMCPSCHAIIDEIRATRSREDGSSFNDSDLDGGVTICLSCAAPMVIETYTTSHGGQTLRLLPLPDDHPMRGVDAFNDLLRSIAENRVIQESNPRMN